MNFNFNPSELLNGLAGYEDRAKAALQGYAETSALKLQNSARQNARWTNRTGQARQRLTGTSMVVANGYKLKLAHGVDYGKWLELAHEKRFAIIPETIDTVGSSEIMPGLQRLLERLG